MQALVNRLLNRRIGAPSMSAPKGDPVQENQTVEVTGPVLGDLHEGNNKWYVDKDQVYYWAGGLTLLQDAARLQPTHPFTDYRERVPNIPAELKQATSSPATVAVIDTGINALHPDLNGAVNLQKDFTASPYGADDNKGHGSAVAGLIGARSPSKTSGIMGLDPDSVLLNLKAIYDSGTSSGAFTKAALEEVLQQNNSGHTVHVVNLSLNVTFAEYNALKGVLDQVAQQSIIVAAAGNDARLLNLRGGKQNDILYPAISDNVIAVGSITAAFANTIKAGDFHPCVDFVMPQLDLDSCAPAVLQNYRPISASSANTALVSGLVSLLVSRKQLRTREAVMQYLQQVAVPYEQGMDLSKPILIKTKN